MERTEAEERLRAHLQRWRSRDGPPADARRPSGEPAPGTAYEAVTRQMVVALTEEMREIKGRLNGLLFLMAGAILLDVVRGFGGP